jgi:hypothetical protein
MRRHFGSLVWLLLPVLAACNLNATADVSSQPITGAPQVQIVSPLPNATYLEGVAVNIQALIRNAGPDIDRIEITVDDTIIASLTQPNESGASAFSVTESWPAAGTGAHAISVVAVRGDGVTSDPASVTVTIVNQVSQPQGQTQPTADSAAPAGGSQASNTPSAPAQPTDTPGPTNTPQPQASNTPDVPMATFLTGVNVRRGPDTIFEPPIGSIAANETSQVLAVNPARTWYKVKYYNGEGWVFGNLLSIAGGDENSLPIDAGPPTPTPVPPTATPIPVTATPQLNVNLVAGNIKTDPGTITCKETFKVFVDIANFGSTRSPGGEVRVRDESNGLRTETVGAFGEIDPGQTREFGPIPLTVDTNHSTEHTITVIVDSNSAIAETNEDDNRNTKKYTLQRGSC